MDSYPTRYIYIPRTKPKWTELTTFFLLSSECLVSYKYLSTRPSQSFFNFNKEKFITSFVAIANEMCPQAIHHQERRGYTTF